jgi:hypothetical protein
MSYKSICNVDSLISDCPLASADHSNSSAVNILQHRMLISRDFYICYNVLSRGWLSLLLITTLPA